MSGPTYDEIERAVREKLSRAGISSTVMQGGGLELDFRSNDAPMLVRVMDDPGHPPRVHLRSASQHGEVTITTQRMNQLKKLIDYASILKAGSERAASREET